MPISSASTSFRYGFTMLLAVAVVVVGVSLNIVSAKAGDTPDVPPPRLDEKTANQPGLENATLAGGCFWGLQGVFQHVAGVTKVVAGYAGGKADTAQYELVSTGTTGHAESVRVTYDPKTITYGRLLQIYFSAAHDPTELNRQGPDEGSQYRSTIFPANAEQAEIAKTYIAQLDRAHIYKTPIVTDIEPGRSFFPAEAHHQDFLTKNPTNPYIAENDLPKITLLKQRFPALYRADAVLTQPGDAPQ